MFQGWPDLNAERQQCWAIKRLVITFSVMDFVFHLLSDFCFRPFFHEMAMFRMKGFATVFPNCIHKLFHC